MSIHPQFAHRIISGDKLVEFRRRPLGRLTTHIVVYATAPVQAVIGVAEVERVVHASPAALWRAFSSVGCIERAAFFAYFTGVTSGFAYVLGKVRGCDPLPLGREGLPSKAPQAFQYLDVATLDAVLDRTSPARKPTSTVSSGL